MEDRNGDGFAEVVLDGSLSRDWDGIVSWQWTWEGGSESGETAMARLPVGQHSVTLEVTDSKGARASDTLTVEALPYRKVTGVETGPGRLFQLHSPGKWALAEGEVVRIGAGADTTLLGYREGATWFAGRGVLTPDAMELTRSSPAFSCCGRMVRSGALALTIRELLACR